MIKRISYSKTFQIFIIIISGFIAFVPVLKNGFINWDDYNYILLNPLFTSKSTPSFFLFYSSDNFISLVLYIYRIIYNIFGSNPLQYHALNLSIHIVNGLLLYVIISKISKQSIIAFFTALVFIINPLKVESVAWVMQGKDIWYTLFYFLSLLIYIRYIEEKGLRKLTIFILLAITATLSSLCKIQSLTLPISLLLIDWLYKQKLTIGSLAEKALIFLIMFSLFDFVILKIGLLIFITSGYYNYFKINTLLKKFTLFNKAPYNLSHISQKKKVFLIYLPLLVITICAFIWLYYASFQFLWNSSDSPEYIFYNGFQRIFLVSYSLCYYFFRFFAPFQLNNFHPLPVLTNGVLPVLYYLSFVFLICTTLILSLIIKKISEISIRRELIFALMFFLISVLPVIQILDIETRIIVADRYLYLASAGLSFLIVILTGFLINRFPNYRIALITVCAVFILSNIIYSNSRSSIWKNSESFWTEAYKHNPEHYYVLFSMGNLEREKGYPGKAVKFYLKTVENRKDLPFLFLNLADSYLLINKTDSALIFYNKATQLAPEYFDARFNMSIAYIANKDSARAVEELNILEKLNPDESKVYLALAKIYAAKEPEKALDKINKAINIRLDNSDYYCERAGIYINLGRFDKAAEDISKALSLNNNNDQAYFLSGMLFLKNADTINANESLRKALSINPRNSDAAKMLEKPSAKKPVSFTGKTPEELINEAVGFAKQSNFAKAIELLDQAIKLDPNNYIAFKNRGNVNSNINKFDDAINDYNIAIKLKPDDAGTFLSRGSAKLKKNDLSGACNDWKKANSLGNRNAAQLISTHCN